MAFCAANVNHRFVCILVSLACFAIGIEWRQRATVFVTALMALLWISDAIDSAVTSLLPIPLFPLLGVVEGLSTSIICSAAQQL